MRKHIFTLMALAAALCACEKEQIFDGNQTNGEEVTNTVREPLVFTATMEGTPGTKATLADNTPNWEVGDLISINGSSYEANAAGTSTTFSMVGNGMVSELRPTYIDGSPSTNSASQSPKELVDDAGTRTKWCDHVSGDGLYIIVSAGKDCMLNSIKLWNGGDTGSRNGRRWKDVKVYGASSAEGPWDEDALLQSFTDLNLAANNNGFAGELHINSSKEYKYYRVEVLSTMGESLQQMSDMKFVVSTGLRPTYVSSTNTQSFDNQPASNLVDARGTDTRWIAHKDHKVEGVWNIVVSTGSNTLLKKIKLWNADNQTYPGRRWKYIQLYGRVSDSDPWYFMNSFDNLNLAKNNKGFAGEIEVNSSKAYTLYKIDVLDNEGDNYMQMSDMKFTVESGAPYSAYFPANLYDGFTASLPSSVSETWAEGKFNMPMYAHSNTTNLEFKNLCGVLKIAVKKETIASVKSIRISSSNKATSGTFTVVNNTAVLESPNTIANTVTVTYTDAVTISNEGTVFYVAIPAQTYQNLKIELSSDGVDYTQSVTTTKNANIAVARNKIYSINFTDVVNNKGRGKAKAKIDGQEVYVDWIQLWEDGPKFAKFNIGAANNSETDYGNYYDYSTAKTAISEWGNAWRMPTKAEFDGLLSKCEIRKTSSPSVSGWLFTGKGEYLNNSVFFPETRAYNAYHGVYDYTLYWSSTTYKDSGVLDKAYTLELNNLRTCGYAQLFQCPIRAVVK